MQLRFLLFLFLLSSASLLPAQEESFNKRYYFGYAAAIINGVYPTDSCIYITGLAADTIPPFYPSGLFFAKLDLNGEVEHTAFAHPEGQIITNWGGGLKPYGEGFLTSAMKRDTSARASLLFLDSMGHIGHTIELHSFFPPHEQSFLTTYEPIVGPNGMILLPTRDRNAQGINNTETVLQLFSANGELLWRKNFGVFDFWDAPVSVQSVGGHFIIGGSRTNSNRVRKNYTGQHHIYAIDTLGNVQWSYLSPIDQLLSKGVSIYAEPNGSVIAAGFKGEEFSVNAVSGAINWSPAYIYKLNPQHQLEWEVEFHEPYPTMGYSDLNKVIAPADGSGYVIGGHISILEEGEADVVGWLAKVSLAGEKLWNRKIRYLEVPDVLETHEIFDLKEMPGGGYLMGGQTVYGNEPSGPIQRGWLLRVDEEGCLVPGCHLVSTEEEEAAPALSLHLYPNPAQEYLYVLLRDAGIARRRGGALQLLDLQGRILQSHPAGRIDEVTSILPVPTCFAIWRTGRFWRRSGWWCGEESPGVHTVRHSFTTNLSASIALDRVGPRSKIHNPYHKKKKHMLIQKTKRFSLVLVIIAAPLLASAQETTWFAPSSKWGYYLTDGTWEGAARQSVESVTEAEEGLLEATLRID